MAIADVPTRSFQRLNTGSLKLSPQELRQALAPGEFTNFVDDQTIASSEIQKLLGRDSPDPRHPTPDRRRDPTLPLKGRVVGQRVEGDFLRRP